MQFEDPRVIRTQTMLKEALLSLLVDGYELHQLSVQKVTKQAQLNRTTFYLHYEDLSDLQRQMTAEILQKVTVKITSLMHNTHNARQEQVIDLLNYLKEQWSIIFVLKQQSALEQHLFTSFEQMIVVRRRHPMKPKRDMYIDSDIKTASIIGVIMWWLKSDTVHTAETIAQQIKQMNQY